MKADKTKLIYSADGRIAPVDENLIELGVWGTLRAFWPDNNYGSQFKAFFNLKTMWLFAKGIVFAVLMSLLRIVVYPFSPLIAAWSAVSNAKFRRNLRLIELATYQCFKHGESAGDTDASWNW